MIQYNQKPFKFYLDKIYEIISNGSDISKKQLKEYPNLLSDLNYFFNSLWKSDIVVSNKFIFIVRIFNLITLVLDIFDLTLNFWDNQFWKNIEGKIAWSITSKQLHKFLLRPKEKWFFKEFESNCSQTNNMAYQQP